MADRIRKRLRDALSPSVLEIEDESDHHAGHAGARPGGETHFRVRIVSSKFSSLSRVERQRLIHAVLEAEFAAGIHALALKALTPEEASKLTLSAPVRE